MSKPKAIEPIKPLTFRYPDNPNEVGAAVLRTIEKEEPGEHIAQLKWDGWRTLMYKESGRWVRHSKYDDGAQAKTQMPLHVIAELDALQIPDGTAFDCEWMGMRAVEHTQGRHWIKVYDLHYFNGQWQGDIAYEERLKSLKTLLELHKARCKVPTTNIELIDSSDLGLLALYRLSQTLPLTEGIVIKERKSKLIGSLSDSVKNPKWMKVKWRR